ncbi:hypothetical protein FKM82_029736 [Ascaphus truei]
MIPMSPRMFRSHYGSPTYPPATHLCYEVYQQDNLVTSGHLTNTGDSHAEVVFISERFLDKWRNCTVIWYISWTPCDNCMDILLNTFLPTNPHLKLEIKFAKVYIIKPPFRTTQTSYQTTQPSYRTTKTSSPLKIEQLHRRGVKLGVMTQSGKYCSHNLNENCTIYYKHTHLSKAVN